MEWLEGNTHSSIFPQKLKFLFPQNWEEWEGMNLALMKFLLKPLKYPFNISPFFSHSAVKNIAIILAHYCPFFAK